MRTIDENVVLLEPKKVSERYKEFLTNLYFARIQALEALELVKRKGYETKFAKQDMYGIWILKNCQVTDIQRVTAAIKERIEEYDRAAAAAAPKKSFWEFNK